MCSKLNLLCKVFLTLIAGKFWMCSNNVSFPMLSWYQFITTLVTFLHVLEKILPELLSPDKINLKSISIHGHTTFIIKFHLNVIFLAFMFYGIIFTFFWLQNIVTLINFVLFDLSLLISNIVECGCHRCPCKDILTFLLRHQLGLY
jgi:hypothetical protein